jgi:beta-glucosidase
MLPKTIAFPLLCLLSIAVYSQSTPNKKVTQPVLGHRSAPLLTVNGFQFKDLNKNGKLDK